MCNKLERMRKETVLDVGKLLYRNMSATTEENH